tara:strand:+ start:891 stop:1067 length:177 start_codon:yes stop_codon:yes gene_type:complete
MEYHVRNPLNVELRREKKLIVVKTVNFVRSKLYIGRPSTYVWALTKGPRLHRILNASA